MSTIQVEIKDGVGTIRLAGPRGNAMSEALVLDLSAALRTVGGEPSVKAVLLTSAHPKIFCPGLDLVSLSRADRADLTSFMVHFSTLLTDLFALKKPMVAAVNGAAVAGGCLLALTADWRVAKRSAPMGLNEVKVGVPLPWSVTCLLRASVPPQALSRIALLGRNFEGDEALAVGLASELADADGFESACRARLAEFVEKDARSLATTKAWLREGVLAQMMEHERARQAGFLDGWFSASTQERIRTTLASLKAKS